MLVPSKKISPLVGWSSRRISRPTVVLPQPDSPTSPSVSPGWIEKLTSSTARTTAFLVAELGAHREMLGQPAHREHGAGALRRRLQRAGAARGPGDLAVRDLGVAMAARHAAGVGRIERRLLVAYRNAERTTRRKAAARRCVGEVRHQAFDGLEPRAARPVEPRHRAQQPHRVGMARPVEHRVGRALFGHARGVHHDDAVGVARHHAEIVRDDDQRDVELARQVLHQLQDLRLDGDVERGGRLVGDDELGIAGEPDRDHHALAHAAGELVRILVEPAFGVGDADELQQLDGAGARLRVVHSHVDRQRLGDLQPDGEQRVERGHRLLEDHRDVAAADLAHLLVVEIEQALAVEDRCGRGCGR